MASQRLPNVFFVTIALVVMFVFGWVAKDYFDSIKPPIRFVHVSGDCSVTILVDNRRRHFDFGRNVVKRDCYDLALPAISDDGKHAAFETRLVLEGETEMNAVYVYDYVMNIWFKVYDYGSAKITDLVFDKDNNLHIDQKIIPYDEYNSKFNEEDGLVMRLIKDLPEVKSWLGNNDNREVFIEDVDDDVILVRVYEYFPSDGHTQTFNWYEYDRLTGKVTK